MYYIFIFRARGSAYKFYERLKREGIFASIINAPFLSEGGCSLAVKISQNNFDQARRILASCNLSFFTGIYYTANDGGRVVYRKL